MTTRPRISSHDRLWCIAPDYLQGLLDRATVTPEVTAQLGIGKSAQQYENTNGVAIIDVAGVLTKCPDFINTLFGLGTAMLDIGQQVEHAADDDDVSAILLRIDSPGGSVRGTADLAATVAAANKVKPTVAYAEDMMASGAYWIGSAAGKVYSNSTAIVGSIGTYAALLDSSGAADKLGLKVHVVRAGAFKGAGTPGTEVTPEQLAEWQRTVDSLNVHFVQGVATGRKMSTSAVSELADGRVHVGAEAQRLGLTDGVRSFADVLQELQQQRKPKVKAPTQSIEQRYRAGISALIAEGVPRIEAVRKLARQQPDLHRAYQQFTDR